MKNIKTTETTKVKPEVVTGEVISGGFTLEERNRYSVLCLEIGKELTKVETSALSIALKINTIYRNKLYQVGNYINIYDMADKEFHIGRTTCNNYINICENFCEFDEEKKCYIGLNQKYKRFSISQLIAMLPMPEELREEVKPDMSVREIKRKREIFDNRSQLTENGVDTGAFQPSQNSKPKSIELLRSSNVLVLPEEEKKLLHQKMMEFEEEHPDVPYQFSIRLIYEK